MPGRPCDARHKASGDGVRILDQRSTSDEHGIYTAKFAKNGIGAALPAAMFASSRPTRMEPVKLLAATRESFSMATPASWPLMSWKVPSGAPAAVRASITAAAAVRIERFGCPEWAFKIPGHSAASADAVSPPATEKANGKLLATRTSPDRQECGTDVGLDAHRARSWRRVRRSEHPGRRTRPRYRRTDAVAPRCG